MSAHPTECQRAPAQQAGAFFMPMDSMYLIDDYASVTPGEPYRLFPYGRIVKGGKTIEFTREYAGKFKLPHFKPPIKRGSHADDAPAGGFIIGLEVREDGLYAIPELNEKGVKAIQNGDYRYHSPEVVWGDGPAFENPQTGEYIHGPLIVGDALLHMPHLGEAAALYHVEPITRRENMTEQVETVQIPKNFWESFMAKLFPIKEDEPEPAPQTSVDVEQFEALKAERDQYQAEIDQMKAEAEQKARVEKYAAAVAETKANAELVDILAGLPDETADRILQEVKALSAQIDEGALLGEKGTAGEGLPEDPGAALMVAVRTKMEELKVDYNTAFEAVRIENPEIIKNYQATLGGA